ncbi:septation protein A [Methylosinus sp. R-45379]|uniref:septation protein A n=1 Tax=unclassified Methylosinus TaxID=2624500 RepID=UPI000467617B|nr:MULTISPECIES: septation protein A [unclassified Methylosinus]OAI26313.1 septation protein A [Methylosinus sp. R-45379]
MTEETTAAPAKRRLHPGLKFALEMGPLVLFFIVNQKFGIFQATAALMVAVVATLAVSYSITRHLPTMPMVTAIFVLVFGSLTFFLQDENFIKLKVTILYALFGSALLGALWFDKLLLPAVFESAFRLDDAGWRKLTWRWALFFFFLAALNEFVRRGFPTDVWVNFKVFGILPLTLLYALSQIPLMMRHELKEDAGEEPDSHF